MPIEYVNASGTPWAPSDESLRKRPKAKKERPKEWHKGWAVVGHRPGECAEAAARHAEEAAEWAAKTDEQRASALKSGVREPKPWDEERWRRTARKHPLRKPFEIPQAAEQMAELALRGGWEDVEIIELCQRG